YKYLGMQITESIVCPQKLKIDVDITNLHEAQKMVGDLQWIRGICGIANEDLYPLLSLLKGGGGPLDP
ncbi:POK6 protein, partial [Eurystomus gularis]|nr:POK6 protein [Eurystomus gularis]